MKDFACQTENEKAVFRLVFFKKNNYFFRRLVKHAILMVHEVLVQFLHLYLNWAILGRFLR